MNKQRIAYIDDAKGILMILVILGHCIQQSDLIFSPAWYDLRGLIYSFHMPAFFMISGMIINNEKYKSTGPVAFIADKAYKILIPYLFFELIGGIIAYLQYKTSPFILLKRTLTMECNAGADWYLVTYFFAVICYYLYLKLFNSNIARIAITILVLIARFLAPGSIIASRWGINLFRILIGFAMILTGNMLKELLPRLKKIYLLPILLGLGIICYHFNGFTELWDASIGNPLLYIVGVLNGTALILGLSQNIPNKLTQAIGQNSICILSTHLMIILGFQSLKPLISNSVLYFILSIAVVAVAEPIIVIILNRFFPFFIGKKSPG